MRRTLLILSTGIAMFFLLCLVSSVVYAQGDAPAPNALSRITDIAFSVLTPVLALFAMWAAHRLLAVFEKKTGIDVPTRQEQLIDKWIRQGIHRAEEWSHKKIKQQAAKLTGPEKLEISADFVLDLIVAQGWVGWTADRIKDKVEAMIGQERAVGIIKSPLSAPPPLPPNVV